MDSFPPSHPTSGVIVDDPLWIEQFQTALQVAIACGVYHSDRDRYSTNLEDVLMIFDRLPSENKRLARQLHFKDPASQLEQPWTYFPQATYSSNEIILCSPPSAGELRVVATARNSGGIFSEEQFGELNGSID